MSLLTGARSLLASGASLPGDLMEDSRKRIGVAALSVSDQPSRLTVLVPRL